MPTRKGRKTAAEQPASGDLAGLFERGLRAGAKVVGHELRKLSGKEFALIDRAGVAKTFAKLGARLLAEPERLVEVQADFIQRNTDLWRQFTDGGEAPKDTVQDRRFKDRAWSEDPRFRFLRDAYLTNADWLRRAVERADGLEPGEKRKARFYTRQIINALAPTNFALTNPQALKRARETAGDSLVEGLKHLIGDLEKGDGRLAISQTDEAPFVLGRNVATTPGKVVYQNDLIQLIQYEPTTAKVYKRPLLFVPPWINKYYILDLRPENSFIRYMLDKGHTLFVISWVNPQKRHAGKSFEHYMREGPLAAIEVVQEITGETELNLGGFCIGGILSVCTLAWLAAGRKKSPIKSATLLATMVDLKEIGETSVFIDEDQLEQIARHAAQTGYLEGHHLVEMFSMLRENDLIWNYVVNNYLMGRDPMAFDMLYWNSDATRLPAAMLLFYLRHLYMENALAEPGLIDLDDRPIDVRAIETPCYMLSTREDHIAPWTSSYPATRRFAGPMRFVLGESGHIAGVVNPPARKKYGYWTRKDYPEDPLDWLEGADHKTGSWWPDWARWIAPHGGPKVAARRVGSNAHPPIEDAPGSYVLGK